MDLATSDLEGHIIKRARSAEDLGYVAQPDSGFAHPFCNLNRR